jgi:hypothetical protein
VREAHLRAILQEMERKERACVAQLRQMGFGQTDAQLATIAKECEGKTDRAVERLMMMS